MYFQTSSYRHQNGEVMLLTASDSIYDDAERPIGWKEKWTIQGQLQGPAATLSLLAADLEARYRQPITFAGLFYDNAAVTHHYWLASRTLGGIKVVAPPGYPDGSRVQFVNARDYTISLEAEFVSERQRNVIAFTETIQQIGDGGQRLVALETRNSNPVIQRTSKRSPVQLVQSGSITGRWHYERPPASLFPANTSSPESRFQQHTPQYRNGTYTNYRVDYSYMIVLPYVVTYLPNFFPRNR